MFICQCCRSRSPTTIIGVDGACAGRIHSTQTALACLLWCSRNTQSLDGTSSHSRSYSEFLIFLGTFGQFFAITLLG